MLINHTLHLNSRQQDKKNHKDKMLRNEFQISQL